MDRLGDDHHRAIVALALNEISVPVAELANSLCRDHPPLVVAKVFSRVAKMLEEQAGATSN